MLILLHGPDDFSSREELQKLKRQHDGGSGNQETYRGNEATLAEVLSACSTMPFLSDTRLVILEGLPPKSKATRAGKGEDESQEEGGGKTLAKLPSPGAAAKGKRGMVSKTQAATNKRKVFEQGLAEALPTFPSTTVLIILIEELLEETNPLLKAAGSHGMVKRFVPPERQPDIERWILQRVKTSVGSGIEADAAHELAQCIGSDLRLLAGELEKLATYAGTRPITSSDVRKLTHYSQQSKIFDLTDALARRERQKALALLHHLLNEGNPPLYLVAMITYQVRTLVQVKELQQQGQRAPQIAQALGMSPYVVEKSVRSPLILPELEGIYHQLLEIDTGLKRSAMSADLALDLLVMTFGETF